MNNKVEIKYTPQNKHYDKLERLAYLNSDKWGKSMHLRILTKLFFLPENLGILSLLISQTQ